MWSEEVLENRKFLNLDTVVEIMTRYLELDDWKKSFSWVLPV